MVTEDASEVVRKKQRLCDIVEEEEEEEDTSEDEDREERPCDECGRYEDPDNLHMCWCQVTLCDDCCITNGDGTRHYCLGCFREEWSIGGNMSLDWGAGMYEKLPANLVVV